MIVHYPTNTSILTEARLYATDSIQHTMDYHGFESKSPRELKKKFERITIGNYGQLWVAEYCRINGIPYHKDESSPEKPDDYDLIAHGYRIDVKTSIIPELVGQVGPGVIDKPIDYFCFLQTDRLCSYVAPWGLISADEYKKIAVKVNEGEVIPGTTIKQAFGCSWFLPQDPELMPFVQWMRNQGRAKSRVIQQTTIIDGHSMDELIQSVNTSNRLSLEIIKAMNAQQIAKRKPSNVILMPINDLLDQGSAA